VHLYDNLIVSNLKHGIRCYAMEAKFDLSYVYFILVIKRGALADKTFFGEAHFVEHILLDFDRQNLYKNKIEYAVIGTTGFDKTIFRLSCKNIKKDIEKLIIIIKNIITGKYLVKDNIDDIRKDIINEYNNKVLDNIEHSKMYKNLFTLLKLSNSLPIGNINDINRIKYEDLVSYFNKNYKPENMAVIALGNFNSKAMIKKIDKVFSNDFFIDNIGFFEEKKINFNKVHRLYKKNSSNTLFIHVFILNIIDYNVVNSKLTESIVITFMEEILDEILDKIVNDVKIEISQFSYRNRFIHITVLPKKSTNDLEKKIKIVCSKILKYLDTKKCNKLLDKIFIAYYDFFHQQSIDVLQQLNQIIEAFLYNKEIYNDNDLILNLQGLSKKDVLLELNRILKNILQNINVYFFQISN
jgi:hypothetical protein